MRPTIRTGLVAGAAAGAVLVGITVYAAINQTIAVGVMEHSALIGGPATLTMRTLTILPGEVLGWHYHPGAGAYTIVKTGTLTVEDGCGGETVYTAGQGFLEPSGRVHRGKNLTGEDVSRRKCSSCPSERRVPCRPDSCAAPRPPGPTARRADG